VLLELISHAALDGIVAAVMGARSDLVEHHRAIAQQEHLNTEHA